MIEELILALELLKAMDEQAAEICEGREETYMVDRAVDDAMSALQRHLLKKHQELHNQTLRDRL